LQNGKYALVALYSMVQNNGRIHTDGQIFL